jgi:GcrA cell cycle regulator
MTRAAVPDTWTEDRLALLTEMQDSAPKDTWLALNKLPGNPLTKSAVIGKRDRMFMQRRPKKTPEQIAAELLASRDRDNASRRAKREKNNEKQPPVSVAQMEAARERARINAEAASYVCIEAKDIIPLHLTIMDLTDETCRWPYGDAEITFCGHLPVHGRPYCLSHCAIGYTAPAARKRADQPRDASQSFSGTFGRAA